MEKVIKDGKVAVLVTRWYGAGWSTWNEEFPELLFHPKIVEMVLKEQQCEIDKDWLVDNLGVKYANVYCEGCRNLEIKWLPIGKRFTIEEYDGAENLITEDDLFMEA
jgi:hypothetical protein